MHVQSFDSFEDLQKTLNAQIEKAKTWILPRQAAITFGDHWMRIWDSGYGEKFLICGYIHTVEELDREERRLGASEEEILEEHETMEYSYNNGFRFGTAYSVIEPRGELGDTHVSQMVPITKEEFEDAKLLRWDLELVADLPWFGKAVERLRAV
jgi:hypothetical protein